MNRQHSWKHSFSFLISWLRIYLVENLNDWNMIFVYMSLSGISLFQNVLFRTPFYLIGSCCNHPLKRLIIFIILDPMFAVLALFYLWFVSPSLKMSETAHYFFFDFCMKLGVWKWQSQIVGKIFNLRIKLGYVSKIGFFNPF